MTMIRLLYIDLFCGAGGTSSGVEQARVGNSKCAKVIACVNHDRNAILSHQANHPDTLHFTEDIRTLELSPMLEHLQKQKAQHPAGRVVLWASLECTNFSKAKGGQPRDADSRTLAEHLFRYIEAINPDYIQIENVEEFMCWGDLDENGKPISRDKGRCYVRWTKDVCSYGYDYDYRLLNAADYGAYTSRKRFFGQFAKRGLPLTWPVPEYSKGGATELFNLKKWKPVREVLELEDEGKSIFARRKPLCEKTLERIYSGLIKFVAGGKDAFLVKYNSMSQRNKYVAPGIDEPCPTVACQNRLGLAKVQFLSKNYSGEPDSKNQSIERPAGTVTCRDHHSFITAYYGNGFNSEIEGPAPTLTTKENLAMVTTQFYQNEYSGGGFVSSIDEPNPAVMTKPKQQLVSVKKWLMNTNYNNIGSSLDEPSHVITANRKMQYLVNPQFASSGGSIDKPCFTQIARMDKMPPYLRTTKDGGMAIAVFDEDSPMTVRIKEFMALYGITDICMRMLKTKELKLIMGFPSDYVLVGTQSEQKKYIGNAVEVNMARVLCEALCQELVA